MDKYLVCLDIDGTLIGTDLVVSDRNKLSLRSMMDLGSVVFLVSGRMLYSAKVIANDISPQVGLVASNGAVIETDQGIIINGLNTDITSKLVKLSYEMNFSLFLFGKKKVFYTTTIPEYLSGDSGNRVHSKDPDDYCKLTVEKDTPDEIIANGIIVDGGSTKNLKSIRSKLHTIFSDNLQLSTSNINNIELIPSGINKGTAINYLQDYYHIDQEHTISFGDGENDKSMLDVSKYSVAMGNATSKVKEIANYETRDYREDGVAYFLENNFLKKEKIK